MFGGNQLNNLNGIAIDSSGDIYVAETNRNRVVKFNSSGTYLSQIGCASGGCSGGKAATDN